MQRPGPRARRAAVPLLRRLYDDPAIAALRREALAAWLAGAVILAAGLLLFSLAFDLPGPGAIQSAALYAVIGAALWRGLPLHLPHSRFGPANEITLLRAVLVSLLAGLAGWAALGSLGWLPFLLALTILALDGADGWAARRSGLPSAFGERFDIEVDSLLLLTVCALLAFSGKAGVWVVSAALLRYLFVGAGLALPWLTRPLPPRLGRKTCFVIAAALLFAGLAPVVPPGLPGAMASLAVVLLAGSFAADLIWLIRQRGRDAA